MGLFDFFNNKHKKINSSGYDQGDDIQEFCPRCQATLNYQKGYSNELPYWICKGCGEMLINPDVPDDDNISWICDGCEAMLNIQEGFSAECDEWKCTECGFINKICESEIYATDDEYRVALNDPYRGMDDQAVVELMEYEEIENISGRPDIILVRSVMDDRIFVKKILSTYDVSVYRYLKEHPIDNMPRIFEVHESAKFLIIIEEYIEGNTVENLISQQYFDQSKAIDTVKQLCIILDTLHNLDKPIIHRDIKPSNIMITASGQVDLLDVNVAKWYKEDESEDTKLLGTFHYAAPEQFGYGFSASSEKADIYALGILLNEMITGKMPKEDKASGPVWNIIERCISLNAADRYDDKELLAALQSLGE